jgi:IMP dehydrogenase/GMP reductase
MALPRREVRCGGDPRGNRQRTSVGSEADSGQVVDTRCYPGPILRTAFTELIGCRVPLQQAGMASAATPEPAAAVASAGGLGMLGLAMTPADAVGEVLTDLGQGLMARSEQTS